MRRALFLSLALAATAMPAAGQLTAPEIAERAQPAVVVVEGLLGGEVVSQGSGFVVSEDGRIVTNRHVIEDTDALRVHLASGEAYDDVFFIGDDAERDLAILRIEEAGLDTLALADERTARIGEAVYVIGNPLGLEGTFSSGLISARRDIDGRSFLQISAPISSGSSGGPVLNANGEVLAVATLTLPGGQNLNMAVPARYAASLLELEGEAVPFPQVAARFQSPSARGGILGIDTGDEDLEPWERVLLSEMVSVAEVADRMGLTAGVEPHVEVLDRGEVGRIRVPLEVADGEVIISGVCDIDCTDLDMAVYAPDDRRMGVDVEMDDRPVVIFTVPESGAYEVHVRMVTCSTASCGYAVQVFTP